MHAPLGSGEIGFRAVVFPKGTSDEVGSPDRISCDMPVHITQMHFTLFARSIYKGQTHFGVRLSIIGIAFCLSLVLDLFRK